MRTLLITTLGIFILLLAGKLVPENKGPLVQKEASPADNQLFIKYCRTCHMADGKGVRGMFPPLSGNPKVTGQPDEVIRIVLFGLKGPITVNERDYNQVMPAQASLTDNQIAEILSYIRNNWENKASVIKPEDVARVRKAGKP
jgi:nitrite reductase (NO-forming)